MSTTALLLRITKALCLTGLALMSMLIVTDNVTDYDTNYYFVAHVLKMDTTFPGNHLMYRSIANPLLYHTAYIGIIVLEAAMAACCATGSWRLWKNLKREAPVFHAAKNWGIAGIVIGIGIWFVGFEVIGGEWFSMWQSPAWNGLAAAQRVLGFLMFTLLLLHLRDE